MNLLDTSVLVEVSRGTLQGKKILECLRGTGIGITAISYYEFLRGTKQDDAIDFLELFELVAFDKPAAQQSSFIFNALQRKGLAVSPLDVLIAGICASRNATLHTLDKDFLKIDSLRKVVY